MKSRIEVWRPCSGLLLHALSVGAIAYLTAQVFEVQGQREVGGSVSAVSDASAANLLANQSRDVGGGVIAGKPSSGADPSTVRRTDWRGGSRETETLRAGLGAGRKSDPAPPVAVVSSPTLSVAQFGKCPAAASMADPQVRSSDNNIGRLQAVAHYLRQGAPAERSKETTARHLLAELQEQLEEHRADVAHDVTLLGTYFGLASELPVTADLVTSVSGSLCTPISAKKASAIAAIGEAQRVRILLGR